MDFSGLARPATELLDGVMDRALILGYTKIGSGLRRRWWAADAGPRALLGKRVLITGATAGIGLAMARSFAELGAGVHLLGRNADKVDRAAALTRDAVPDAHVVGEVCDVSDLDAVRQWSADFANRVPAVNGLVHNAGLMPRERTLTPQGHEVQLATHVLGPHLMTEQLLPLLRAAGGASVVFVSSGGMYGSPLVVDDLECRRGYNGVRAYARTKKMQVVLADSWARRLAGTDIRVESMHPGWVDTPGVAEYLPRFRAVTRPLLRDVGDGADTAVWLVATRPESKPGHFWHDRSQRPTTFGWQRQEDPAKVRRFLEQVSRLTGTSESWPGLRA
ncbi:SDR family NAD(P)-dependent oxidoreductase [Mycobacterium sp. CVI_P3]|uniref:SDR family NAD(P)-dependent oxidoreductase n=1 Tax=Mycobacterium pinniadriaticum TaxID=2994102 RepID=A0ABT3S8P9_9MYCO|nr:SDR family NAD(P)-dependent oxidoreductase [Mycobacterium pinniadriaticum]MCX2928846.1 SDR family NAD(P)-dependent oxidoreductase [Mycobacterium pinniadriaticum]MCX2935287.1 SDR family NAD(P)-dependent oxidoreductase [Mycobacterium pinniadriaticum]